MAAASVLHAVNLAVEGVENLLQYAVGVVVVIAVLWSSVPKQQAGSFVALVVCRERVEQLLHGQRLHVENVMLDGGERVGATPRRHRHDVGGVVARAAIVVVPPAGDAVVYQDREER